LSERTLLRMERFSGICLLGWDYTTARTSRGSWRGIDMEFETPPRENFSAIKSC
jgi:hypothetical protein